MNGTHPITDTALAAALATLGIPLSPEQALTRAVDTITGHDRVEFNFLDGTNNPGEKAINYKTEWIVGAWLRRSRLEAEHPTHPLVAMRAALDARSFLLDVLFRRKALLADTYRGDRHHAGYLWEAALLIVEGFPLLSTTGKTFDFPNVWKGRPARELVARATVTTGRSRPQWIFTFLMNLSHFLTVAKDAVPRLIEREGNNTLNLSADAPTKLSDQMHKAFADL